MRPLPLQVKAAADGLNYVEQLRWGERERDKAALRWADLQGSTPSSSRSSLQTNTMEPQLSKARAWPPASADKPNERRAHAQQQQGRYRAGTDISHVRRELLEAPPPAALCSARDPPSPVPAYKISPPTAASAGAGSSPLHGRTYRKPTRL
nr:unnamed protein product [Digitaria exilis]